MKITLVAAVARDRAIGLGGDLPWRLPGDLRRFRRLTVGHAVVMGRKTWDSLPRRPLPKRLNIVLSRDPERCVEGAVVASGLRAAARIARDAGEKRLFVIGGSSVYEEALPLADSLVITHVETWVEGADARFPEVEWQDWRCVREQRFSADDKNALAFTIATYHRGARVEVRSSGAS